MLIRAHQVEIFTEHANRDFAKRLADYLLQTHGDLPIEGPQGAAPVSSLGGSALLGLTEECLARGRQKGLTWEASLASFAVLMVMNGPRFEESREIRKAMDDPAVPRESLPDHLALSVPEAVWQQARAAYPGGWRTFAAYRRAGAGRNG